jgi:hypothetical protein
MYRENPKTKGSGIICAIPQTGECPVKCDDCFFQSGRSFLEPIAENLPNVPDFCTDGYVVRMNDGNDSNVDRDKVLAEAARHREVFFNTSIAHDLEGFPGPVVLTLNPGRKTDTKIHLLDPIPKNLMMVRFRTNLWNRWLLDQAVQHYTPHGIPVNLTFMAYYTETIPVQYRQYYHYRQRTMNSYWVLKPEVWDTVIQQYRDNPLVQTCGKDATTYACRHCGGCLREYFACKVRMQA